MSKLTLSQYDRIELLVTEEHIKANQKSSKVKDLKPGWTRGRVIAADYGMNTIIIDIPGDEQTDPSFDFTLNTLEWISCDDNGRQFTNSDDKEQQKKQMVENIATIAKKVGFSSVETNVKIPHEPSIISNGIPDLASNLSPEKAILLANKIIEEETIELVRKRLSMAEYNIEAANRAHNETKSERDKLKAELTVKQQENLVLAKAVKELQNTIDQIRHQPMSYL